MDRTIAALRIQSTLVQLRSIDFRKQWTGVKLHILFEIVFL